MIELGKKLCYSPLYWAIIITGFLILYILNKNTNKIIGWFGEYWVKKELAKLPKDKYKVLNDVFIMTNGFYHQIDHVVVSKYGIFCIETKQYNGFIYGDKYDKKWIMRAGKKEFHYNNPIRQNYGHVIALSELLNIDKSAIYNIVCIPSTAKLNINHDGELTRNYNILKKIYSYKNEVIVSVDYLTEIIKKSNINDEKARKEHIRYIINNVIEDDNNKCPKCGGALVERNGKFGVFLGCVNYPKCKYTRNIK